MLHSHPGAQLRLVPHADPRVPLTFTRHRSHPGNVSKPVTPESLRAEAEALDAEAERLRGEAQKRRALAGQIEQLENPPLQSPADNAYNAEMSQAPMSAPLPARPRGAPLKSKGPVARVAKILGVSGADVAWLLNAKYQTAMSWDGKDRQVPEDIAPKLEALVASPESIAAARKRAAKRPR